MADKERKKEAKIQLHGASYDALLLAQGQQATGEIDTSSIEKSFSFQTSDQDTTRHDGSCKVDYDNCSYQGMVFVVHRTRGMLLFSQYHDSDEKSTTTGGTRIPGGIVSEEDFLGAAKRTGLAKMQLQLAARAGAARQLFCTTGIDMRNHLDRLTPAVLQMNPSLDAKGTQYLKNEHENKLYFFLQIDDNDFVRGDSAEREESCKLSTPSGEPDSPLKLKLAGGFADFTFIKDPLMAVSELKENGDPGVTTALSRVMNQSLGQNGGPAGAISFQRENNAKGSSNAVDLTEADEWKGVMTIVRNGRAEMRGESPPEQTDDDISKKASSGLARENAVTCCCGFW